MRHSQLQSDRRKIADLIKRTQAATAGDFELQGHWGRYLCVLAAGFLENALRDLLVAYVQKRSDQRIGRFTELKLARILNPKTSQFVETVGGFDRGWAEELKAFADEDGKRRRDAVDSIMNNRHQIAHGKSTSISVSRIQGYFDDALKLVEFLEDLLERK